MRLSERSITRLLIFFVIYLAITGTLILFLRSLLLDDRMQEMRELESRIPLVEQQLSERERQEQDIIRELISVSGAQDFEDAYRSIRDDIARLEAEVERVDGLATVERQLRLDAERSLDDVYARVQALELERMRLEANLDACLSRLSSCTSAVCS